MDPPTAIKVTNVSDFMIEDIEKYLEEVIECNNMATAYLERVENVLESRVFIQNNKSIENKKPKKLSSKKSSKLYHK